MENKLIVKNDAVDPKEYLIFIEECRAILTEAEFTARWTLLEAYHAIGKMIIAAGIPAQLVAGELGKSERTIQYAVKFAETYPEIETLPGGKSMSWRKVIKLISEPKNEAPEVKCHHCPIHCPCG